MPNVPRNCIMAIAFVIALTILAGTGAFLYRDLGAMSASTSWEAHSYQVLRQLDTFLSALQDAETGQRGFIITGDSSYLQPYQAAQGRIQQKLISLRQLTVDDAQQQKRVEILQTLVRLKQDELRRSIQVREREGLDAGSRVVKTHQGKQLMDGIRTVVAEAKDHEKELLRLRSAQRLETTRQVRRFLLAGAVFGVTTLLLVYILLHRELLHRAKTETALESQNAQLLEVNAALQQETRERLRTAEEARQKERMLIQQSRMAAMGEMLNNIGHQWRQPLNVLGLTVQEILLMYDLGECSREYLESRVKKAAGIVHGMSQTIEDFRSFSLPDEEKIRFRVDRVVQKTLAIIGENLEENGVKVDTDLVADLQVNGYPNEFAQVLINILLNARDAFQEREKAEARVKLRSWMEDGKVIVTITDNAGGISEEILPQIFDPYFTTKDLGKGTGIGLFLSKRIIENKMGGRLTACNIAGGAQFKIEV